MKQIILDVETKKAFEDVGGYFPDRLGVSFVGVCFRDSFNHQGEMKGFFENDLPQLFPLLEQADVVIGFNIDHFDMQALSPYYSADISRIPTLDLMNRIKASAGHRISLDAVAQDTLGAGKSGNGLDAILYYRQGEWDKLRDYCLRDVEVTRDLYDFGLNKGKVKFKNKWNRLIECPVDFSYVPQKDTGMQMSLL